MISFCKSSGFIKSICSKVLIGITCLLMPLFFGQLQAQNYATEHYLPPFHNVQNGNDVAEKVVIHLTTMETSPFTVSLYWLSSSGSWVLYTTKTISKTSPAVVTINCNSSSGDCNYLTAMSGGSGDPRTGFKVSGSSPFYVNVDIKAMSQAGSYSSKGLSAKGKEFFSAQFESNADDLGKYGEFISIMAVESGTTTVNFTKNNNWYQTANSTTLNEGEVYILSTDTQADGNIGTKITSDKDIVVVSGTWAGVIGAAGSGAGRDIGVTQLLPTDKLGTDYLVHEGYPSLNKGTHAIVVATENTTYVYANGSYLTTLNAGQNYQYNLKGEGNNLIHLNTSKRSLVYYQGYTSGASSAKNNQGLFLVAPLLDENNAPTGSSHAHYGRNT